MTIYDLIMDMFQGEYTQPIPDDEEDTFLNRLLYNANFLKESSEKHQLYIWEHLNLHDKIAKLEKLEKNLTKKINKNKCDILQICKLNEILLQHIKETTLVANIIRMKFDIENNELKNKLADINQKLSNLHKLLVEHWNSFEQ